MRLTIDNTKRKVLLDSLKAVAWGALPEKHHERKAAEALMKELQGEGVVTINETQRLYVIPCDGGYSCLGFDVAYEWARDVANWLHSEMKPIPIETELNRDNIGTLKGYEEYRAIMDAAGKYATRSGKRCDVQLTPQLIGLEHKRVEVVDRHGETRRFRVGKSTGWLPIHLELEPGQGGGGGVTGAPFRSVSVLKGSQPQ